MRLTTWLTAVRNQLVRNPLAGGLRRTRVRQRQPLGALAWIERLKPRELLAVVMWDGGGDELIFASCGVRGIEFPTLH